MVFTAEEKERNQRIKKRDLLKRLEARNKRYDFAPISWKLLVKACVEAQELYHTGISSSDIAVIEDPYGEGV